MKPWQVWIFVPLALTLGCTKDFNSLNSENGRQAIIDQANDYLTAMMCDSAITILKPLVESPWVTTDIRMLYSSAYACKGGLNFAGLIAALKNMSGSDIWTPLVAADYAPDATTGDVHKQALESAAEILRIAFDPTSYDAVVRPPDANVYMIFIHMAILSSIISPLGRAASSGHKTTAGWAASSTTVDQCRTTVAVATISDCLGYVSSSAALKKVSNAITGASGICGGACPTTKIKKNCTAADDLVGLAILTTIDGTWSF